MANRDLSRQLEGLKDSDLEKVSEYISFLKVKDNIHPEPNRGNTANSIQEENRRLKQASDEYYKYSI